MVTAHFGCTNGLSSLLKYNTCNLLVALVVLVALVLA